MWRSRSPPIPLDFDSIVDGSFDSNDALSLTANAVASGSSGSSSDRSSKLPNGQLNGNGNIPLGEGLKDQRALTLKDNLELFVSR